MDELLDVHSSMQLVVLHHAACAQRHCQVVLKPVRCM
jgi:hypothetical protein